ncbi:hypothetical protein H5410_019962 [Solanum commersonii]|uniref:Uncharacterized protein n=1 Tax=Solanum commersonii TaxID=4109 RepID=A0A9J5Z728_SOLCO|nr:hypothetical protein H5410_019962 [Solanum commersonii]
MCMGRLCRHSCRSYVEHNTRTYDLELSVPYGTIWSSQADRASSLFGCLSSEHTAELMGIPTKFPRSKFFIVILI